MSLSKAIEFIEHPLGIRAAFQLKYLRRTNPVVPANPSEANCYELLKLSSRSFVAVIMELEEELQKPIMVFYLVLRALDTIEDDMTLSNEVKVPMLLGFHENLKETDWTFDGSGPDERDRVVLVKFDQVLSVYHTLKPEYQDIIKDITREMGFGMAKFIKDQDFNLNGVRTIKDYDLYCHYVAGLVGEGSTKLIVAAEFGDPSLNDRMILTESMALLLQKTNIIRDYKEDLDDGRTFWPQEIWGKYAKKLADFEKPENLDAGLHCVSELVLNALGEVRKVLIYLSLVNDHSAFNFCAIPQVMAIATLAEVFENPLVFKKNVKIRKGTTCQLILDARTYRGVLKIFSHYLRVIHHKCPVSDPNYLEISLKCGELEQFLEELNPDPDHLPEGVRPVQTENYLNAQKKIRNDKHLENIIQLENSAANSAFVFLWITFASTIFLTYVYIFRRP
ncbi:DEKNAAC103833 [Brettanomyces naardenensis]|uniref:Squalene synthase n=1 Tax=Brettanomyces naardenensis TaxID=13370 RepID=A0A448YPB6_BRENA|nr:DEKNAAC103833 [Brettanomyces naardenensis]